MGCSQAKKKGDPKDNPKGTDAGNDGNVANGNSADKTAGEQGAPREIPTEKESPEQNTIRRKTRDENENILVTTVKSLTQRSSGVSAEGSTSMAAKDSQVQYASPDQTIIIFDWDDTLLPSRAIRAMNLVPDKTGRVPLEPHIREQFDQLEEQAIELLQVADSLGKVILVTNARRPWVSFSCKAFLPKLAPIVHDIPTLYALEFLGQNDYTGADDTKNLLTETKMRAMKAAVTSFYSRYPGQSWKNIITIGDALFEHNAVRQVVQEHKASTNKKVRTKTFKFIEDPTPTGLKAEVCICYDWLQKLVELDEDIDIDLSSNEAKICDWTVKFSSSVVRN